MDRSATDSELIDLVRSGDRAAMGLLFERYSGQLLGMINKLMGPALLRTLDASDVLQETLMKATARFQDFQGSDARELRTWLRTLARRRLIDIARHNGRLKRALKAERSLNEPDTTGTEMADQLPGDLCTASQVAVKRETNTKLVAALEHIDRREAEVLWLRYVDGLGFESIGRQIGVGRNGVRGIVARGLRNLRRLMPPA